jgi:hypothetical protein
LAIDHNQGLTANNLKPHLERCGYGGDLLRANYCFGNGQEVALVGFARSPTDARSACVVAIDAFSDPTPIVSGCRSLGAPIVLVCWQENLQWWKQGTQSPQLMETIHHQKVAHFFQSHQGDFSPDAVYRAKTWGRFDQQYQLSFVDIGLMSLVESEVGKALGDLIARAVSLLKSQLRWRSLTSEKSDWLLKSVFWLVAAKILRDKGVDGFGNVDLSAANDVFNRVARHYGTAAPIQISDRQRDALGKTASMVAQFSNLAATTTESMAYVYENTLISQETRSSLGTHSTPSYLVDYVVGKLLPWIEKIPVEARVVFEPACGHAAFLIAAMRVLREILPGDYSDPKRQQAYLRKRLRGQEVDPFALEIARLSLTLADIPNPNGWDLRCGDMFTGNVLQQQAKKATVLLANPPFEDFTTREKSAYRRQDVVLRYANKTAEMLSRALPSLPAGAVFGVVVPQTLLGSDKATTLREYIVGNFDILDVCELPDNLFALSEMESAVIVGRKVGKQGDRSNWFNHRIVRRHDVDRFRQHYRFSVRCCISQTQLSAENNWNLHVPELAEAWASCKALPTLAAIATSGQGLFYLGRESLPPNTLTISDRRFPGAKRGFAAWHEGVLLHEQPHEVWMNVDPSVVDREVTGATTDTSQVLLNYAPVTRGPWRLKALIDRTGHPVTNRFITVRPRSQEWTLEYLWAILNSPVANAFAYTHSGKRDNLVGMIRKLPVPNASEEDVNRISGYVAEYLRAVVKDGHNLNVPVHAATARNLMLRVDAEVLGLYDLPPRLERQILDLFAGWERQGVPFVFDRYYPDDYEPCFLLREYLSSAYSRSTAGYLRNQTEPRTPAEILQSLREAAQAFEG